MPKGKEGIVMSSFEWLVEQVSRIPKGAYFTITRRELTLALDPGYSSSTSKYRDFHAADWILENIMGSAYEYGYTLCPNGDVSFWREAVPLNDGRRTYVSPDQKKHFLHTGRYYIPRR